MCWEGLRVSRFEGGDGGVVVGGGVRRDSRGVVCGFAPFVPAQGGGLCGVVLGGAAGVKV